MVQYYFMNSSYVWWDQKVTLLYKHHFTMLAAHYFKLLSMLCIYNDNSILESEDQEIVLFVICIFFCDIGATFYANSILQMAGVILYEN